MAHSARGSSPISSPSVAMCSSTLIFCSASISSLNTASERSRGRQVENDGYSAARIASKLDRGDLLDVHHDVPGIEPHVRRRSKMIYGALAPHLFNCELHFTLVYPEGQR